MAIFRCKMCGGDLEVTEGASTCTCDFCGTRQTIPTVKEEELQALFNRANVLRMKSEFDKAAEIYEKILQKSESEADAYWCLILCKYGIEYVEDPQTFRRVPTCHRASYDAVTADEDYRNAIRYADSIQREIYESEAKVIDEIQRGIIALAQKEDPYDVFICYKETDENGKHTPDSVIANDIYYQLTQEGFKVFYAAITLESKLGTEYEPYIFSALNTAKVMLSIGTKPEYFNAVWVKNEWSRFLKNMKKDRSKLLIPCYKDMDPYELPEEFAHLQAQDMGKIGFINDIVRGIKKVIAKNETAADTVAATQSQASQISAPVNSSNVTALIKRGYMALEDCEWDKADGFFEEALNQDAECGEAYAGKLLAAKKLSTLSDYIEKMKVKYKDAVTERLEACQEETAHVEKSVEMHSLPDYLDKGKIRELYDYDRGYDSSFSCRKEQKEKQLSELAEDKLLSRARKYAKGDFGREIEDGLRVIEAILSDRIAQAQAEDKRSIERITASYKAHMEAADDKAKQLRADAEASREKAYQTCVAVMNTAASIQTYENARNSLKEMNGYKDTVELAAKCQQEIEQLKEEKRHEEERLQEVKRREEERRQKAKKKKLVIFATVTVVVVAAALIISKVIIPYINYNAAVTMMNNGDYVSAYESFVALGDYKDSVDLMKSMENDHPIVSLPKLAKVGSEIFLGTYEQDNNTENGKESIGWIVLKKNENRLLIVSKDAIDCQPCNSRSKDFTWEDCSLRGWLNDTFYNTAFSTEEKTIIEETTVVADKNPKYSTNQGNNTQDKVFLLSIAETEKYFVSNSARTCKTTAYAVRNGAYANTDGICRWWLRSSGNIETNAACVGSDGLIRYAGSNAKKTTYIAVRPALWLNLKS